MYLLNYVLLNSIKYMKQEIKQIFQLNCTPAVLNDSQKLKLFYFESCFCICFQAQVWGVAYEIAKEDEEFVTKQLDIREKNGYDKVTVQFYPSDPENNKLGENFHDCSQCSSLPREPFDLVIYVGTEDNEYFAGAADIESIAQQIVGSVGPSGTNTEYLYKLASAMHLLAPGVQDEHLFALEEAVRHLENQQS